MMHVWRLSVMYVGPKTRTERPRKTKTGTEVAHVTRDSDTTFKVKRSKVNLQGVGAYCGGLPHRLYCCILADLEIIREQAKASISSSSSGDDASGISRFLQNRMDIVISASSQSEWRQLQMSCCTVF